MNASPEKTQQIIRASFADASNVPAASKDVFLFRAKGYGKLLISYAGAFDAPVGAAVVRLRVYRWRGTDYDLMNFVGPAEPNLLDSSYVPGTTTEPEPGGGLERFNVFDINPGDLFYVSIAAVAGGGTLPNGLWFELYALVSSSLKITP